MATRQLGFVFDLNKCIGCHTCTIACKQMWTNRNGREYMYWNNVESQPGMGYPKNWHEKGGGWTKDGRLRDNGKLPPIEDYGQPWDYNYSEFLLHGKGERVEANVRPTYGPNWDEEEGDGIFPNNYYFYLPRICNHCTNPSCLASCPRNAIYKRPEDGLVVIDQKRCRGYRYCVKACPYGKVYFNLKTGLSEKCIGCYPRVERGTVPACMQQCVGRLRFASFRDDKDGPVYKLVDKWKVAVPLHPEKGTQPNVFYVPPLNTTPPVFKNDGSLDDKLRIPIEYLESLFGPEVRNALDVLATEMTKRRNGQSSDLMETLIGYRTEDRFRL